MSDWKFLGRYAITSYPSNPVAEYVVVGKSVVGYCELGEDNSWTYYQFAAQEKGQTKPSDPIAKASGATAADAANKGLS